MAILDELLFIKTFREKKAETVLQKSRGALLEAHRREDLADSTLTRFVDQAVLDEDRWYRALCARTVLLRDIAEVQQDVAILRATEQVHAKALDQARSVRESAAAANVKATAALREASAVRQKFVELARTYNEALGREAERKEELEMEEVASVVRERDEWTVAQDG